MGDSTAAPDTVQRPGDPERDSRGGRRGGHDRTGPPRARLVVRVGVTGHRPNRLAAAEPAQLRARVREVLELVRRAARDARVAAGPAYTDEAPVLRVISPLAEGADRIVAEEGLALGFELHAPLPFPRAVYEEDFDAASRDRFRDLLEKATAVLEMDGGSAPQARRDAGYEAAGRMTILQCDVLVSLWDGDPARGRGGTPQVIAEALRLDLPVVWVQARPPHQARALVLDADGSIQGAAIEHIVGRLTALLQPPPPEAEGAEKTPVDLRAAYFAERQPRTLLPIGWIWRSFRGLVEARPRLPRLRVPPFERATDKVWQREWQVEPPLPAAVAGQIDRGIERHYAWADGLASYYADQFRSAFVVNYLLATVAVFLALLGLALGWREEEHTKEYIKLGVTIAVILLILLNTEIGKRRRWHERWIDYRLLAESLRILRFLAPLGRVPPFSRPPPHLAYGDPTSSWMMWHLRAIVRQLGLVGARFEPSYLESCRVLLHDVLIGGQVRYHRENAERLERLERRLRWLGLATFLGVLVVLVTLFVTHSGWLTLLEAVLPALGGALGAIRGQAELERLVKRSRAMGRQLQRFAAQLEEQDPVPSSVELGRVAEAAAGVMLAEHLDWRVVFQQRPLELPG